MNRISSLLALIGALAVPCVAAAVSEEASITLGAASFSDVAAAAPAVVAEAGAEEAAVTPGQFVANNVWMMLAAGLVFIMHLGFATLESGLTRAKNTTNILFKNTFIISAGILTYAFCGFNLMYPGEFGFVSGWLGFAGFGLDPGAELSLIHI